MAMFPEEQPVATIMHACTGTLAHVVSNSLVKATAFDCDVRWHCPEALLRGVVEL